jgi:Ras-related protein Rab-9A/Ras-related protein Rab-9B
MAAHTGGSGAGQQRLLKVVILGDGGVGKSSLMQRFVNNEFDEKSFHTMGVEFLTKGVNVDGTHATLQIWDTAGQERYRALRTPYYRGADCCILTFDLTDRHSFENLDMWRGEFLHYADVQQPELFPFVLLGNKEDMAGRQVAEDEAREWCRENHGIPYFETSAMTSKNVETAFVAAARLLQKEERPISTDYTDAVDLKASRNGGCC